MKIERRGAGFYLQFPLQADRHFPSLTIYNCIFQAYFASLHAHPLPHIHTCTGVEKELAVMTRFMAVLVTVITWKEAKQTQWHSSGVCILENRWERSRV